MSLLTFYIDDEEITDNPFTLSDSVGSGVWQDIELRNEGTSPLKNLTFWVSLAKADYEGSNSPHSDIREILEGNVGLNLYIDMGYESGFTDPATKYRVVLGTGDTEDNGLVLKTSSGISVEGILPPYDETDNTVAHLRLILEVSDYLVTTTTLTDVHNPIDGQDVIFSGVDFEAPLGNRQLSLRASYEVD